YKKQYLTLSVVDSGVLAITVGNSLISVVTGTENVVTDNGSLRRIKHYWDTLIPRDRPFNEHRLYAEIQQHLMKLIVQEVRRKKHGGTIVMIHRGEPW